MAITIGFAEAKNNFSRVTAEVNRTGRPVTVLKNNKPWVTISPAAARSGAQGGAVDAAFDFMDEYADVFEELCPTLAQKAARYAYGIASNHPFVDGNKRTTTAVMGAFLRMGGRRFAPDHGELLAAMLDVADGSVTLEELSAWLQSEVDRWA